MNNVLFYLLAALNHQVYITTDLQSVLNVDICVMYSAICFECGYLCQR